MVSKRARAQLPRPKVSKIAHLTPRQAEVLRLAARGLSGKQIAHRLGISVRTVEDHFAKMRQHTGTHSQGELIAYEATVGLLAPPATVAGRPGSRNEQPARRRRRRPVPGMISATRPQTGAPIRDETRLTHPAARDEMQRDNSHCQVCGEPITEAATGRPRVYCSRACQQRAYRARQNTVRMAGPTIIITGIAWFISGLAIAFARGPTLAAYLIKVFLPQLPGTAGLRRAAPIPLAVRNQTQNAEHDIQGTWDAHCDDLAVIGHPPASVRIGS